MTVFDEVRKELSLSHSIGEIKRNLTVRGYLEADINKALDTFISSQTSEESRNDTIFSMKEFMDRIAYGFASPQFVNILFALSGASLFLIGFTNGLKTIFSYILSGFLKSYSKLKHIGKNIISASGILFGFSFLGMTFSVMTNSPIFFALSLLAGTFGIIAHGDLYTEFLNDVLKSEKRRNFLKFISYFGIIITAGSMLLAGFLIDMFPISGHSWSVNLKFLGFVDPVLMQVMGHLLVFEITAIIFIVTGYLLSFIKEKTESIAGDESGLIESARIYIKEMHGSSNIFKKNLSVKMLTVAMILGTIIQVLINSYSGVYIYYNFKGQFMKGFLNVAIIFVIALIASIFSSMLTKKFAKSMGEAPMLVFGTLLASLLPLVFYYNPHLFTIAIATALSVVGGSISGVAQGLIAEKLMTQEELNGYYSSLGFFSVIPTFILVTTGAILAQFLDLKILFLYLALMFIAVIMPLYFVIVLISDKEYRRNKALRNG